MRLADFILRDMELILQEWENFAATQLPAAEGMTALALRDHAEQILEAVAKDLVTFETREARSEKSKGNAPSVATAPETAAQTHATLRAQSDFDIKQMVAEYRALRASVLRLYTARYDLGTADVMRFNEAIDQAVAESVAAFEDQESRARNLLLMMLGHDMRSPLNTIVLTAAHLAELNAGAEVSAASARLIRSSESIRALMDDLVDFSRTKLGLGVKINPYEVDLAAEVTDEVEQLRRAHPQRSIELAVAGDHRGLWDGARLKQVVRNLVTNAHQYGSPDTPVRVALRDEENEIWLEVTNSGPLIDPSLLSEMFKPMTRGPWQGATRDASDSLGLGLFIVREIVTAHGGEVEAHSSGGETVFTVRLPRRKSDASGAQ